MTEKDAADELRISIEYLIKDLNNPSAALETRLTSSEIVAALKAFLRQHVLRREEIVEKAKEL